MRTPLLSDLPEELLVNILSRLKAHERYRGAALVCKAWRQAAHSPQCVQNLSIRVSARRTPRRFEQRLRSLAQWLLHNASNVEELSLSVNSINAYAAPQKATALLSRTLAACCGKLTHLALSLRGITLPSTGWLDWSSLQRLEVWLDDESSLRLPGGLTGLLRLVFMPPVDNQPNNACLPAATLVHLQIDCSANDLLPPELSTLTRLQELHLDALDCQADGYEPLAALHDLRRLCIKPLTQVPDCLPQLTRLVELVLNPDMNNVGSTYLFEFHRDIPEANAATLDSALPLLTRLTALELDGAPFLPTPPAALTCLTNLRRFRWIRDAAPTACLPGGAWLAGLRQLGAPWRLLSSSLAQLATAGRLESLLVVGLRDDSPEEAAGIVHCAAGLPSLQSLTLVCRTLHPEAEAALQDLSSSRPAVHVRLR